MLVAQSKHALCSMRQEMLDYTGQHYARSFLSRTPQSGPALKVIYGVLELFGRLVKALVHRNVVRQNKQFLRLL